jgi:ubiquinone/menaquinone biosynthesis C-methylase UbiE
MPIIETSTSAAGSDRPGDLGSGPAPRPARDARGVSARLFDLWSEVYDVEWVQRLAYRPVHDAVLEALRQRPRRAILDLGCGTGLFTRRLCNELPTTRVVGCDFSSGMLEHANRERAGGRWVRGNALELPFAEGGFDTVVSTEAFHWFPHPRTALAQIHRTLEPGGQLLLAFINPPSPLVSEAARISSRLLGDPLLWPTPSRMRGWLAEAGFRIESQHRIRRLPAGHILPPVLTSAVRRESS